MRRGGRRGGGGGGKRGGGRGGGRERGGGRGLGGGTFRGFCHFGVALASFLQPSFVIICDQPNLSTPQRNSVFGPLGVVSSTSFRAAIATKDLAQSGPGTNIINKRRLRSIIAPTQSSC